MIQEQKQRTQITWYRVSIVERFTSVLYPFDMFELLKQLPAIGYIVPDLVLRGTPEPGKPIAQKGDIELVANPDNKTIGVSGRNVEKTVAMFEELRNLYLEHLDPLPGLATHYVEFDGEGWAKSGNNPVASFASFWANNENLTGLSGVVGSDVTNFGVHLVPPNKDPNDPEWFQIYVGPLIPSAARRYHVRYTWRGADTDQLIKKFADVNDTVRKLIARIEGK